ncbi:hypothetical protein DT065_18295 [Salicibibacter kimchii]|uniref:Uncharacterized protein n=1 Tax=Salicibibacter kimchii TaxID=2099786 RepID=A0A345C3E7_9BACI|nr:hypothetical protein DT065_18295 [Salicibibacter kimchii]
MGRFTIAKGGKRKNKAEKVVKGFRVFDKVQFSGKDCFIFGLRASGSFDLRLLGGTRAHKSANDKKLTVVERASILLTQVQKGEEKCRLSPLITVTSLRRP